MTANARRFRDSNGREWDLTLNIAIARRVRDEIDIDVYTLADDGLKPLAALLKDVFAFMDVAYWITHSEKGQEREFGEAIADGDVIEAAASAFVEALIHFFPNRRARESLRKVIDKSRTLSEMLLDQAERDLDAIDLEEASRRFIAESKNSPAASGSTPAP